MYVGVRIAEIQQLTCDADWRHIPTSLNPADLVSRGTTPNILSQSPIWWQGPSFIREAENCLTWPSQSKFMKSFEDEESVKPISSAILKPKTISILIARFSSFRRLVRFSAYMFRFVMNARKMKKYRNVEVLSVRELDEVCERILYLTQREVFYDEIKLLTNDYNNLIRVGGRLRNIEYQYDNQHQIIVPKGRLAYLLLLKIHQDNLHCGPQLMLSTSRQKYWILGARNTSRQIVHQCIECFKQKPILLKQIMADLPKERLHQCRPFQNCGVDFCGPFFVRLQPRSKTLLKVYVSVFTCCATRATHLEVVKDLTAKSFLASLRRFVSRRSSPNKIFCDNATNFVGGKNELAELRELYLLSETQSTIKSFCTNLGISWTHIPPRSPHWGGLWESIVKQFKHHLKRVSKNLIYTMEGLETIKMLTIGHLLTGGPLNMIPEPTWTDTNFNLLNTWQQRQFLVAELWKKFYNNYIQELQKRSKWRLEFPDVTLNTLVLIHDDNVPPCQWKRGRVIETFVGRDNHVRKVKLRTATGECIRPIVKIAPLPPSN